MPKNDTDYSSTVIYKITCRDPDIPDKYVGHTTNFVQRKSAHKRNSNNETSVDYRLKLYQVIRDNGGWDNWKMEMIQFYDCKNHYEARVREQEHYIELKATLNSIEPLRPAVQPSTHVCETCVNTNAFDKQLTSNKHNTETTAQVAVVVENTPDTVVANPANKYVCIKCDYSTSKLQRWNAHISTAKHIACDEPEKKYECDKCHYATSKLQHWNTHILTAKHTQPDVETVALNTEVNNYVCKKCEYSTTTRQNWDKHVVTAKHLSSAKRRIVRHAVDQPVSITHDCSLCDVKCCNKSALVRHNKSNQHVKLSRCVDARNDQNAFLSADAIRALITDYAEFKQMVSRVLVATVNKPTQAI